MTNRGFTPQMVSFWWFSTWNTRRRSPRGSQARTAQPEPSTALAAADISALKASTEPKSFTSWSYRGPDAGSELSDSGHSPFQYRLCSFTPEPWKARFLFNALTTE